MKKLLSILLTLMLICTQFASVGFAAYDIQMSISKDVYAVAGQKDVEVIVNIESATEIGGYGFYKLDYDSNALTLTSGTTMNPTPAPLINSFDINTNILVAAYVGTEPSVTGNILKLTFDVADNAPYGTYPITCQPIYEGAEVGSCTAGSIVLEAPASSATVTAGNVEANIGETVKVPVKLATSAAVDSIALRDFKFDNTVLEFTGFSGYSALEDLKAFDFTLQNNPIYASFALKNGVQFDSTNENILTLEFKALKAGSTNVSFNAVVKADAKAFDTTVTAGKVTVTDPTVEVTSVEFDTTAKELTEGDTFTVNATVKPDNATVKTLSWASDNEAVAVVDQDGKVTAIAAGTAKITATASNGKKAECTVTVKAKPVPKTASFTVGGATVKAGDTFTLPVKLNTTAAVDSIALRDFTFDNSVLEFAGFTDYSALENLKALDFTLQNNPPYASFALNTATVFDASNEAIVSLTFKALKEGTANVSFTAVVKNDAEVVNATVNAGAVTVNPADPVVIPNTASFTLEAATAKVGETVKVPVKLTTSHPVDSIAIRNLVFDDTVLKFKGFADYASLNSLGITNDVDKQYFSAPLNAAKTFSGEQIVSIEFEAIKEGTANVSFAAIVKADTVEFEETVTGAAVTIEAGLPPVVVKTASFALEAATAKAGETVKVPVKLTTSDPADSIAIRDLVYDNTVLKFKGFADYDALNSWGVTNDVDKLYFSAPLNMSKIFDGTQIVTLEFEALKEGTADVSFTAVVKNDTEDFEETVTGATVTVEAGLPPVVVKTASFALEAATAKAGETVKVPVKLTTSDPADSIAIRDLVYDNTVLKFKGFADYDALNSWGVTNDVDKLYFSAPLNMSKIFDGTQIVTLEFEALKEGTADVSFTAVVKNDTEDFEETVTGATVTVEAGLPPVVVRTANFTLDGADAEVGENVKVSVKLTTSHDADSIAIRDLVYDNTVLEFVGFADYEALEANSAWDVTVNNDMEFLSTALNSAKTFNDEAIVSLEFKALKEGSSNVTFAAVVKNDASDFEESVNTATVNVEKVEVTEVTLDASTKTLTEGENFTLTATVSPSNATDKAVTWKSSNESVATVDQNGKVTAVAAGNATITATAGTKSASCELTVKSKVINVTGVTLSETTKALTEGENFTLTATVAPSNATNKDVTWKSSDATVAKVENGKVTALKAGTATITVETVDGKHTATCEITVVAKVINVTGVTLNETAKALTEGENFTLTATVAPANATNKDVTWKSSDDTVAKVENGKVTALKAGTATITVETVDGKFTATCEVTVAAKVINVTGVTLNETAKTVVEGESFTLAATVAPANATNKAVTWKSSDESVAKVENGVVTTLKPGTATITVETTDGKFTATCEVTVNVKVINVTGVELSETAKPLTVGESFTLTETVTPDNATNKAVTWKSSDATVAKVENGKVTALKAGTATITVETVDGGFTAECVVTVNAKVLTGSIELSVVDDVIICSDAFGDAVEGTDYEVKWYKNGNEITVTNGKYTIKDGDYGATFTVKAIANGTTYSGEFTDEVTIPAKAPSEVNISTSTTATSITATFTAKANGSAISKFVVTITDKEAYSDAVEVTEADGKFKYTFDNLETGVEYTITAKAVNDIGESEVATVTATPKKKTSSGGGSYPQVIRPATGGSTTPDTPVTPDTPDKPDTPVTPDTPVVDPEKVTEVEAEDGMAEIKADDLKDKEVVIIDFEESEELPVVEVEADIKDKELSDMKVTVEVEEDETLNVEIVAKDLNGNEIEVPVDVKIESAEDKDAVMVDENGVETALETVYDAEAGILEIKNVTNGNIKLLPKSSDWFDDDNGRWSEPEINKAASRGLVSGKATRIFDPAGMLTRHESNKLQMNLVNALGVEIAKVVDAKFDTPADHWAYASDDWAVAAGIMKGTAVLEDGTLVLSGEANITRQDFMTIIYRMMKSVLGNFEHDTAMANFADAADVADYATDAVAFLSALNIVKGSEVNGQVVVSPTAQITREEAAAIINRVFDVVSALK